MPYPALAVTSRMVRWDALPVYGMGAPKLFGVAWVRSSAGMDEHFASDGNSGQDQPRFVGYQTQLDQAERCFQEVLAGAARVLLISGDEGIGKTRFLQQIQTTAAYWGMRICAGRCHAEVALPLAPFVESLLLHIEAGLTDASPFLHLDVDLVRRFRHRDRSIALDLSDATSGQANPDKLHLFLAISRAAVALARHRPTLIVVDDLHWADPLSLELFAHLAFTLADLSAHESIPLCLVGAHRPAAATRLGSLLSRFQRERIFRTLELAGFDEPESATFVATLGIGRPSHQLVTMIREIAQGNPFVIQAVVHAFARQQALRNCGGDWVAHPLQPLTLPKHVTGDITDRIKGLRPELRQVLILAALIGYRFSPYLLSALSGRSEEALLSLLEEAEQQQWLLNEGDDCQFAHPLIRHAFSTAPNGRQRQRLHQQIAQALEELYMDDREAHLGDIAYHLIRAGSVANMDTVSDYARRAAEHAARLCSWTDAARYYEAALTAAQARGYLDPHTRAELHYQAGQAHQRAMDIGLCLDHYHHAIEAYQQTDHIQGLVRTRIEKTRAYCTMALVSDRAHIDVQPLQDALAALLGEDYLSLRGAVAASIAEAYWTANQIEPAEFLAAQALHIGVNSQDVRLCAQASHVLALIHTHTGRLQEALEDWQQALRWAQQAQDTWLQGLPLSRLALALYMLGRLDEAKTISQEAVALTQSTQDWRHYAMALSNLIALHVVQGDFATAERHARDTRLMEPCSYLSGPSSHALCTMAYAHMLRGAWTAAEQCLTMQLEPEHIFEASDAALELAVPLFLKLIQGYAGKGFESDAGACAIAAAQTADTHPLPLLCAVAEIGYLISEPQVSAQVYTALHHAMDRDIIFTRGWIFLIPRVLGLVAALNQWWDQADRHFQVALEVATRVNAQPELGRTYLDYALMLEARGHADDLGHVQQFASQARTIFTHLGMVPFLQRADDLQQRLQPSAPDAPQERHPVYTDSRGERVSSIFNRVSQTRTQFLA